MESLTQRIYVCGLEAEATYPSMLSGLLAWLNSLKTYSDEQLQADIEFLKELRVDGLQSIMQASNAPAIALLLKEWTDKNQAKGKGFTPSTAALFEKKSLDCVLSLEMY